MSCLCLTPILITGALAKRSVAYQHSTATNLPLLPASIILVMAFQFNQFVVDPDD
jgi:hypothetical protein